MRGPFSDTLLDGEIGQVADAAGGPHAIVKVAIFVTAMAIVLISFFTGFEVFLEHPVPNWILVSLELFAFAVVTVGGTLWVFRFMTRRRRGY